MQIVYSYLTEESKKEKTPEETEVYPFLILQEMRSEMCRWLSLPPPLKSPQRQFASLDATPRKSAEGNTTFPRDNTIQLLAQSPSSERLSLPVLFPGGSPLALRTRWASTWSTCWSSASQYLVRWPHTAGPRHTAFSRRGVKGPLRPLGRRGAGRSLQD